jgi:hypothetical protein
MTRDEIKAVLSKMHFTEILEFAELGLQVTLDDSEDDDLAENLGTDFTADPDPVDHEPVDIVKLRDAVKAVVRDWYRQKSWLTHPDHGGSAQAQSLVTQCRDEFLEMVDRMDFPSPLTPSQQTYAS